MSVASSAAARRLYTRYEFCAPTACVMRRCRPSIGRSSSPSYCTRPVLGGDSQVRPTDNESTPSSVAACAAASVRRISLLSRSSALLPTINCSTTCRTPSTFFIICSLRNQLHLRTTTFVRELTIDNYLNILDTSQTQILLRAYCIAAHINTSMIELINNNMLRPISTVGRRNRTFHISVIFILF